MSKKPQVEPELHDVRVESMKKKTSLHAPAIYVTDRDLARKARASSMSQNFVYINSAYDGSMSNINERTVVPEPPTSVIREQYWACSKWPYTQRILAIAVGVLLGAVLGLAITMGLRMEDKDGGGGGIGGLFRSHPAPD